MINVYAWSTMNARKIYTMLEETGLPYRMHPADAKKRARVQSDAGQPGSVRG